MEKFNENDLKEFIELIDNEEYIIVLDNNTVSLYTNFVYTSILQKTLYFCRSRGYLPYVISNKFYKFKEYSLVLEFGVSHKNY